MPFLQYIDGNWCGASTGATWNVVDPATEEVVCAVPWGGTVDCKRAIEAATAAFPEWSRRTAYERSAILIKTAYLIRERVEQLHPTNTRESGKTIEDARGDWMAAAALFEWFAEEGKRAYGRTVPARKPGKRQIVLRQPIGVVGIITAWNFPAYNPARAWAAALAAGCTVVARPSEFTPLTAMQMTEILIEAGLPKGVLNLVCGDPAAMAEEMLADNELRKISFTGSVGVGKKLMAGAAKHVKRLSLELGGNAPVLVFPDADLDALAASSVMAKFRCTGQVCVSPQRFLVHEAARDEFLKQLVPRIQNLRVGPGADASSQIGPLINAKQRDRVEALVADSTTDGARVRAGGKRPASLPKGFFFEPTVLDDVAPGAAPFRNEIFGPVLPVTTFDDVDKAISLANRTEYGLAAYVWTNNLGTAMRCAEQLEFGMVGINEWTPQSIEGPFGGWKQSGLGTECGSEGLDEYLETKLVGIGPGA